jgi:hypothetical protein
VTFVDTSAILDRDAARHADVVAALASILGEGWRLERRPTRAVAVAAR